VCVCVVCVCVCVCVCVRFGSWLVSVGGRQTKELQKKEQGKSRLQVKAVWRSEEQRAVTDDELTLTQTLP
jgi:hypothetical protein